MSAEDAEAVNVEMKVRLVALGKTTGVVIADDGGLYVMVGVGEFESDGLSDMLDKPNRDNIDWVAIERPLIPLVAEALAGIGGENQ
jgi:hypothetical protein